MGGSKRLRVASLVLWALMPASPAAGQVIGTFFEPIPPVLGGAPSDPSLAATSSDYNSSGIRVSEAVIHADLQDEFGYNTNVLATANGSGSTFNNTTGSLLATTDWSRNSAYLSMEVDDRRYLDLPKQSFTEWLLRTGGAIDVGHDSIDLTYDHLNLYQLPGALNAVTIAQPVAFRIDSAEMKYNLNDFGKFIFTPALQLANYDYDNFSAGGLTFDQAYRDRFEVQPELATRYEFAPQQDGLLLVRDTELFYRSGSAQAPRRNSNTQTVLLGVDYPQVGSNFHFRVLAGVQSRQYSSSAYARQTGPTVELSVTWTPTRLTTLALTCSRDIQDAADENIAGYFATTARFDVNHELRRNVMLNAYAELQQDDYQSSSINVPNAALAEAGQNQSLYTVGGGVTWLLNRHLRAGMKVEISKRQDSVGNNALPSSLSDTTLINLEFVL